MAAPLAPFIDRPASKPGLGFDRYAQVFAKRLLNADPPRMTTGIFGGYGSGKTTLMKAIEAEVKRKAKPNVDLPVYTVWFDAWRYDHEEFLFLPFLAQLSQQRALVDQQSRSNLGAAIRSFLCGLNVTLSLKFLQIGFSPETEGIEKLTSGYVDIPECIRRLTCDEEGNVSKRVVAFIDDLDRCRPEKALGLIEAMMAFLDIDGFLFVIGLDRRAIAAFLDKKYGPKFGVDPEEYLEKLVQDSFTIPPFDIPDTLNDLHRALRGGNARPRARSVPTAVQLAWDARNHLPRNLRQIKRILNTHEIITAACRDPKFRPETLLSLLIMQACWPFAYGVLEAEKSGFVDIWNACASQKTIRSVPEWVRTDDKTMAQLQESSFRDFYNQRLLPKPTSELLPVLSLVSRYGERKARFRT